MPSGAHPNDCFAYRVVDDRLRQSGLSKNEYAIVRQVWPDESFTDGELMTVAYRGLHVIKRIFAGKTGRVWLVDDLGVSGRFRVGEVRLEAFVVGTCCGHEGARQGTCLSFLGEPEPIISVPNAPNHVTWYVHSNPALTRLDPRWERQTGQPLKDVLNMGWIRIVHPDDREKAVRVHRESQQQAVPYKSEYRVKNRGGKYVQYSLMAVPIFNHLGEVLRWEGVGTFLNTL